MATMRHFEVKFHKLKIEFVFTEEVFLKHTIIIINNRLQGIKMFTVWYSIMWPSTLRGMSCLYLYFVVLWS